MPVVRSSQGQSVRASVECISRAARVAMLHALGCCVCIAIPPASAAHTPSVWAALALRAVDSPVARRFPSARLLSPSGGASVRMLGARIRSASLWGDAGNS